MNKDAKTTAPAVKIQAEWLPKPFIDGTLPGDVYTGHAPLGVQTWESGWQICKTTMAGSVQQNLYPQGSMGFEFVWDDRATYTYGR